MLHEGGRLSASVGSGPGIGRVYLAKPGIFFPVKEQIFFQIDCFSLANFYGGQKNICDINIVIYFSLSKKYIYCHTYYSLFAAGFIICNYCRHVYLTMFLHEYIYLL